MKRYREFSMVVDLEYGFMSRVRQDSLNLNKSKALEEIFLKRPLS